MNYLEKKLGWITVYGLPLYIVAAQGLVYIWTILNPEMRSMLTLDVGAVIYGKEVWRIVTYLFVTDARVASFDNFLLHNPLFVVFYLYLFYAFGSALEDVWGSFPFTIYYLLGAVGTTVMGLLFGNLHGAYFLNLSIFLAFATVHPEHEIFLFFVLPVKVKWLGAALGLWWIYLLIVSPFFMQMTILAALINYTVFFTPGLYRTIYAKIRRRRYNSQFED